MVFTLFHTLISFIVFRFSSFEIFSFFSGVVAPDIESVYFIKDAYEACGAGNYACMAAYPSHWFLHSFLGITFMAFILTGAVYFLRKHFSMKQYTLKMLFISAWIGGLTHLIVDSTVHEGEDALMLLFPYPERYSFIFPHNYLFWHALALLGAVLAIFSAKKFREWLS